MKYLLDVNSVMALGVVNHQFHARVISWAAGTVSSELLTCPTTELGFVRVLSQASYGYTVREARDLLLEMKRSSSIPLVFVSDHIDISALRPRLGRRDRSQTDIYCGSQKSIEPFSPPLMPESQELFSSPRAVTQLRRFSQDPAIS